MSDSKWYFTEEQLANSPSRKCGINAELELSYRQRAANLIQEMGQRLQVSQLCINTAIVYMHRFYAFHSFTMFHRNSIAAAAFFLAAKVEEQPRKLEHVIKIHNICLEKQDVTRDMYTEQAQELVLNENILLQTLGFDVAIDHPHTHVVKACQLFNIVTVSRELRQTCYFMASNSLHLTTMCLKYRPTVVAAFCIYIACKWSRWEIPDSSEGKAWYSYVDDSVTLEILQKLTDEYLQILERSPSKFKSKMKAITTSNGAGIPQNPSMGESSSSHHKNPNHHEKHHHHHHRSTSSSSVNPGAVPMHGQQASNGSSRNKPPNDQKLHMQPNSNYKQNVPPQQQQQSASVSSNSSSTAQQHRQRPPYTSSSSLNKSIDERQRHQDQYYQQQQQRLSEKHRMSMPSSQQQQQQGYNMKSSSDQKHSVIPSNSSKAHQQQPPPYPSLHQDSLHSKSSMKHNQGDYHNPQNNPMTRIFQGTLQKKSAWNQPPQQLPPLQIPTSHHQQQQQQQHQMQYIQKNHPLPQQSSTSSSTLASMSQQQQQLQSQQQQQQMSIPTPSEILQNNNNNNNMKQQQSLMINSGYGNEIKPPLPTQNDFWFNETPIKPPTASPSASRPTTTKSLFSPSPEHTQDDKAKYMMMTSNIKRETPLDIISKDEKKLTPNKQQQQQQKTIKPPQISPQIAKNEPNSGSTVDLSSLTALSQDTTSAMMNKKRPYSTIKDSLDTSLTSGGRNEKIRKTETSVKPEVSNNRLPTQIFENVTNTSTPMVPIAKQPIETNPDIVKSLLKECFSSTSNKFDPFDNDSPLDVINSEPPEQLLAIPSTLSSSATSGAAALINSNDSMMMMTKKDELKSVDIDAGDDKLDSSACEGGGESSGKHKKKSKKKKDKHKHKKKHKHSDQEGGSPSLRLVVSKSNSPESNSAFGGLKIKIPIKDVASVVNPSQQQQQQLHQHNQMAYAQQQPAPLKLKISKGSFTNVNNNNNNTSAISSSPPSSSSHKKKKEKDKHRDKEKSKKSSKHRDRDTDFKETSSYHHQQHTT